MVGAPLGGNLVDDAIGETCRLGRTVVLGQFDVFVHRDGDGNVGEMTNLRKGTRDDHLVHHGDALGLPVGSDGIDELHVVVVFVKRIVEEVEGKHAQADDYLFEESCLLSNAIDSLGFFNDSYNVYERRKDWEKASVSLAKRADIQDRIVKKLLAQSTTHALECFYKDRLKWEQLRTRNRHWMVGIIGVFLLAIIILLIWLLHKKDQKLLEDMACFQEFGNELSRLKDNDVLTYQVIERLISDKVQSLQSLSESYFAWDDDAIKRKEKREGKMMKDDVIHAFRNQLSELRKNQSFIQALEDMLDMTEHGIMKKARSLLDTENELDFTILTLLFSGFSIKSISYLLRMSEASLRMRKTRYKHRFETFQEPIRDYQACFDKLLYRFFRIYISSPYLCTDILTM